MAGQTRVQSTIRRWKKNRDDLMNGPSIHECELELKDSPSKASDLPEYLQHLQADAVVHSTLHDFYGARRFRNLSMKSYSGRKIMMGVAPDFILYWQYKISYDDYYPQLSPWRPE
jgi:hypothetical protein